MTYIMSLAIGSRDGLTIALVTGPVALTRGGALPVPFISYAFAMHFASDI